MIGRMKGRDGWSDASRAWAWIVVALGAVIVLASIGSRGSRVHEVAPGVIYCADGRTPAVLARVAREHRIGTVLDVGTTPCPAADRRWERSARSLRLVRQRIEPQDMKDPGEFASILRITGDPDAQPVLITGGADEALLAMALHCVVVEAETVDEAISRMAGMRLDQKRAKAIEARLRALTDPLASALGRSDANSPRLDP